MNNGLLLLGCGKGGPAELSPPTSLTRTVSGLIFRDGFVDTSNWDLHEAGSQVSANGTLPLPTYYQHDRVFDAVSGTQTKREPLWLGIDAATDYVFFDFGAGDGSVWRTHLAVSNDGGLTLDHRGPMAFPLENGHEEYSPGTLFGSPGAWYFYVMTSGSRDAFGTPNQPYGNHLFTSTAAVPDEAATWAKVSDNDPALGAGGSGYDGENGPIAALLDDAGAWNAYTSTSGTSPTQWHVGLSAASSPLGPWTHVTADLLPANVQGGGRYPENFRPFSFGGGFIALANSLVPPSGAIWYADTLAHFATSGQVFMARTVSPGDAYGNAAWNFWSPRYLPDGTVSAAEADGTVGVIGSGAPTVDTGYQLYAGQIEPAPRCLLFAVPASDRTITASPALPTAWVMECVFEYAAAGGNLDLLFALSNPSGDIGATTCYFIDVNPIGSVEAGLYKGVAGTYTVLGTVTAPQPGFTPTDFCGFQTRLRVAWDGTTIQFAAAGNSKSVTPSGPLTGTGIGLRAANLNDGRVRNLSIYASDTVTLSGLPAGATVALCGANGLPAVVGTADGSGNLSLAHSHYPLYGIRVGGALFIPSSGAVWGGDSYTYVP